MLLGLRPVLPIKGAWVRKSRHIVILAVAVVLVAVPAAHAVPAATRAGDTVTVKAPPRETNVIDPRLARCDGCEPGNRQAYSLEDKGFAGAADASIFAGPGCTPGIDNEGVLCGDFAGIAVLQLSLNDGNDRAQRPDPLLRAPDGSLSDPSVVRADYNGGPGNDRLRGGAQDDTLNGGTGNDVISGMGGDDLLIGGRGHDVLSAGPGNDVVQAGDGTRDEVRCGPGFDRATVDAKDAVSRDCEKVRIAR
jgi:RTX calcium-binding nonapeptide repeat (4 copies)